MPLVPSFSLLDNNPATGIQKSFIQSSRLDNLDGSYGIVKHGNSSPFSSSADYCVKFASGGPISGEFIIRLTSSGRYAQAIVKVNSQIGVRGFIELEALQNGGGSVFSTFRIMESGGANELAFYVDDLGGLSSTLNVIALTPNAGPMLVIPADSGWTQRAVTVPPDWALVGGTTLTVQPDGKYIITDSGANIITIPSDFPVQKSFEVVNRSTGSITFQLNGSQVMRVGVLSSTSGGQVDCTDAGAYIQVICTDSDGFTAGPYTGTFIPS